MLKSNNASKMKPTPIGHHDFEEVIVRDLYYVNALSDGDLLQLKNDGFDLSKFIDAVRWNGLKAEPVIVAQN